MTDRSAPLDDLVRIPGVAAARTGPAGAATAVASSSPIAAEFSAFRENGWEIVSPTASAAVAAHPIYRDADGALKIDGGALNIRFRAGVEPAEINRLLARYGLKVRRRLGFAEHLYLVTPERNRGMVDAVDIARHLVSEPILDYAEPVLIEVIAGRAGDE